MWCRIALWDCFMNAMASLIEFYKVAQQSVEICYTNISKVQFNTQ